MEESLVSLETAILAKEKSFDEPCYYYFNENFSKRFGEDGYWLKESLAGRNITLRPTQAILQKWMRDVHKINITPVTEDFITWCTEVLYSDLATLRIIDRFNNKIIHSYEDALEAGLQKALKSIK